MPDPSYAVRGVVPTLSSSVDESHQASVLDAVAFCSAVGKTTCSDRSLVLMKVSS